MKDESVLIRYIKKKQGLLTTSGILATVSTGSPVHSLLLYLQNY
ncbi:MAG: hypothetical protein ACLUSM_15935 [Enterococcus avium]